MKVTTLDNPKDFFNEVTKPAYSQFINTPSTFHTAFSVAMGLFNICEWVFEYNKTEIEAKFGKTYPKPSSFWQEVETQVPEAKFVRDLSNASKHVKLTIRPSTSMTHIANTSIIVVGWGEGGWGQNRYGGQGSVTMKDGSSDVSLDDCVKRLYAFWESLIEEFYPSTAVATARPTTNQ